MKINVTQKDIDAANVRRGSRNPLTQCLIAIVLTRRHIKFETVGVGFVNWAAKDLKESVIPKIAQTAVVDWCFRKPISPFSFELEVPQDALPRRRNK
jgi:hypothetical protein